MNQAETILAQLRNDPNVYFHPLFGVPMDRRTNAPHDLGAKAHRFNDISTMYSNQGLTLNWDDYVKDNWRSAIDFSGTSEGAINRAAQQNGTYGTPAHFAQLTNLYGTAFPVIPGRGVNDVTGSPPTSQNTQQSQTSGMIGGGQPTASSGAGQPPVAGGGLLGGGAAQSGSSTSAGAQPGGGWNFGQTQSGGGVNSNNQTMWPTWSGTQPQNLSGGLWNLGGNYDGTARPAFIPQGIENWNPNDPRSQQPGKVDLAQGGTYQPRQFTDFYGAGVRLPFSNQFQQYGTSLAMAQPILPTFPWAQQRAANNGGTQ